MASELRATCPFCLSLTTSGKVNPKLYINEELGVYNCKHCDKSGRIEELPPLDQLEIAETIVRPEKLVMPELTELSQEALAYVKTRLRDVPSELSYSPQRNAVAFVATGVERAQRAEPYSVKYRHLKGDTRWGSEPGSQVGYFWLVNPSSSKLIITEGHFDALAAREATQASVACLETTSITASFIEQMRAFKEVMNVPVHVVYTPDNDEAGKESLVPISMRLRSEVLGWENGSTFDVVELGSLPYKDFSEYYAATDVMGKPEAGRWLRDRIKSPHEKNTIQLYDTLSDIITYQQDKDRVHGISTGFPMLDVFVRFRPHELSVVNSFAKSGKSTFINNVIHSLTQRGHRVAIASFEMRPDEDLYPTLLSIAAGRDLVLEGAKSLLEAADQYKYLQNNLYCWKTYGRTDWKSVKEWALSIKPEFLFIDHVGFVLSRPSDSDENQKLAMDLSASAQATGMHICAVVQSPKPGKDKNGNSLRALDEYSAFGGTAWSQNSNLYMTVQRSEKFEHCLQVKAVVGRNRRNTYGHTPIILQYERETGRLNETSYDPDERND